MTRKKKASKKRTSDAVDILERRHVRGDAEMAKLVAEEYANSQVARKLYDLRRKVGLTQKQLADLVGTSRSVIARLEDADYQGHSLAMLNRIAAAVNKRVDIRFVSIKKGDALSPA